MTIVKGKRKRDQISIDAIFSSITGEFVGWCVYRDDTADEIYLPSFDEILNRLGAAKAVREYWTGGIAYIGLPSIEECNQHIATLNHIVGHGTGGMAHKAAQLQGGLKTLLKTLSDSPSTNGRTMQNNFRILVRAATWLSAYRKDKSGKMEEAHR